MNELITLFQTILGEIFDNINIYTQNDVDERTSPYILVECDATEERIAGNRTWEYEMRLKLSVNAHDWKRADFEKQFNILSAAVLDQLCPASINPSLEHVYVYSVRTTAISAPETLDDDLSITLTLTIITQQ
ncbi:MAG: hypothetical protein R3Y56_07315 [Akkermansia sp.]